MEGEGLLQVFDARSGRIRPASYRIQDVKVTLGAALAICLIKASQRNGEFHLM